MSERRAGLGYRVRRLLFPAESKKAEETEQDKPKELSVMFHLHSDRSVQIDPGLLSQERVREISDTFRDVTGYSIDDLSRKSYHFDKADELVFGRAGRVVDNHIRLQVFLEEGCQLRTVGSGDSAICSALAAEAISLRAALGLVTIESKAIAIAQSAHGGGIFRNPELPFHTRRMEPYLEELDGVLAETDIKEPKVKIVGGNGKIITTAAGIRQEIMRQPVESSNEEAVRLVLRRLSRSPVQEIGLDRVDNTKKYLTIGAILMGGAIVAVVVHDKRQKAKKA